MPYKLPLKFIALWAVNLAVLLTLSFALGWHEALLGKIQIRNLALIYLAAGAVLASLEQSLWDKLKGND